MMSMIEQNALYWRKWSDFQFIKKEKLKMHSETLKDQNSDEYLTVAQLSHRYPAFSQGSIRWLIFNMDTNGFNIVVRKIGRKVVLSLSNFKKFIENQVQ